MADEKMMEVRMLTCPDWEKVFESFFGSGITLWVVYKAEKSVAAALSIKEMGVMSISVTSIEQRERALMVAGIVGKRFATAFSIRPMGDRLYLGQADWAICV